MKSVEVRYFALLRELAGKEREILKINCETYGELYCQLADRYSFSLPLAMIQVAVDDEFSQLDQPISDGVKIVFIPPVAGG
jgi:molybdopterin synthase sulfur carrier subunit